MFFLSRTIVQLLSPLNISLFFLLFTLILLTFRKTKLAGITLVTGVSILVICGYGIGVKTHVIELESRFIPVSDEDIDDFSTKGIKDIVILGSGHVSDPRLPESSQLGSSSLYRLIEGLRIYNRVRGSRLIVCGGIGYDPVPNAQVVSTVAEMIGVERENMTIVDTPRDTMQEAVLVKALVGDNPFFLVTSALHMPRAVGIFRDRGMNPIASPTHYIIKKSKSTSPAAILPDAGNLVLSEKIIYEWVGTAWTKIKKSIKSFQL